MSAPRRWVPASARPVSVPPSPPRVWEFGPRQAEGTVRRSGAFEPGLLSGGPSKPPEPSFPHTSDVMVEPVQVPEPNLASALASMSAFYPSEYGVDT